VQHKIALTNHRDFVTEY